MTQDQKDACAAAHSQAEEWNRLAQDFLHTSKVCVSNILELLFDDIAYAFFVITMTSRPSRLEMTFASSCTF